MNTDQELLELAAKAAGIEIYGWDDGRAYIRYPFCTFEEEWNPLEDDGNAFRLAVLLHISIGYTAPSFSPNWAAIARTWDGAYATEASSDLPSATRRAIVRVAAEIGKGMK